MAGVDEGVGYAMPRSLGRLGAMVMLHAVTTLAFLKIAGLGLDLSDCGAVILMPSILLGIYGLSFRFNAAIWSGARPFFENILGIVLISACAGISTYGAAKLSVGYVDASLINIDRDLGFDWLLLYRWLLVHPIIRVVANEAYGLLPTMPIIVLAGLALSRRAQRARRFVIAYGVTLYLTIFFSIYFPCKSALPIFYPHGAPYLTALRYNQFIAIEGLRSGTLLNIPVANLIGLVNFPSFHAASGILFIWAVWPMRRMRWPMLIANLAMILAAPVEGNHYMVDIIAGVLVALLAIGYTSKKPFFSRFGYLPSTLGTPRHGMILDT